MSTAEHRPCRWSAKLVRHSADGDAVFKMTAPYHRTVASYDFFNDYRGYFIVSFEFRRPESGRNLATGQMSEHLQRCRSNNLCSGGLTGVCHGPSRGSRVTSFITAIVSGRLYRISRVDGDMFINRNRPAPFSATCAMMSIG